MERSFSGKVSAKLGKNFIGLLVKYANWASRTANILKKHVPFYQYKTMKLAMTLVLAFLMACAPKLSVRYSEAPTNMDSFLADAVFNGMRKDGFPKNIAQQLLDQSHIFFVGKCPICTPVKRGISEYIANNDRLPNNAVPATIMDGLKSEDKTAQQEALSVLIGRYTTWQIESLHLSEQAKEELMGMLRNGRKQGMARKSDSFGTFCPSCDGACKIKRD